MIVAECPAIPGCVSQGQSEDEALANIRDAILTWHATWQEIADERRGQLRQVEVRKLLRPGLCMGADTHAHAHAGAHDYERECGGDGCALHGVSAHDPDPLLAVP